MNTQIAVSDPTIEQIRVRVLPDGRMTREAAAAYLGLKPKTLAMWAVLGKGPGACRVGGRVFYFKNDLDAFIQGDIGTHSRRRRSTSDTREAA